ncbi:xanthine dehydrogenase family protein molybdopterin-binding subunit [Paraburkholderia sp. LEh10]|uniref:xanthine dehydrogenase family protein molybdopterin-binding subunit n=1 Tax=Paraburkholderia sp. LEh10 TaxID=2821353 RepID=UPI001AE124EF|nr:xanthine dehydrogenase family protein molybdopterin-binding subunit [Paraburkholderia sp. LEh10]MBP0590392.1 xanthine dehydrogenase family protein molybdopterin-binding subunit [Paraburkholderia sp. LEh10]
MANPQSFIGRPVARLEDTRLTTGHGCYTDDIVLPGQLFAVMVRSPYPHAEIKEIKSDVAAEAPGVVAIFVGSDLVEDGVSPIPHDNFFLGSREAMKASADVYLVNRDGSETRVPPHRLLPLDRTRYVGEAVAMVVADSVEHAKDAAELVEVTYAELPFIVSAKEAIDASAPRLWEDVENNICLDAVVGDEAGTNDVFETAPKTVRLDTHIQRVTGVTMEPRAAIGCFDATSQRFTLYAGSSGVVRHKIELAKVLGVPEDNVRVIARDVGGNFGTKNNFYPELGLVAWAARRLGRPVRWTAERQEAFLSDYQGRDLTVSAELAMDDSGRFLAIRGVNISNLGAYYASSQPLRKGVGLMSNVYDIPLGCFRALAVVTNTVPTTPFRSAGRPEAIFVIERLIDMAALKFGFDRVELRHKNMIQPDAFPYHNPLGLVYDNGNYPAVMDEAMRLGDWAGFDKRAAAASDKNRRRGIGVANYVEITTGFPKEKAEILVTPLGKVNLVIGTISSGQGHETSFSQLVAEWLAVPIESVTLLTGDTDTVKVGGGSISGRSMRFASVVIAKAVDQILVKAKRVAAHLWRVEEGAIVLGEKGLEAADGSSVLSVFEIARMMEDGTELPSHLRGPLFGECEEFFREAGFPFGAQVCEVEVDLETGVVSIENYAAVDDVGRAINPLILHGQTHGGAVQGIGQALMEQVVYDPASGQLLSGSLMDYALPRACGMPKFKVGLSEIPSPSNPLGIRAGGEGGTTPALAVVVNAVVDALKEFGVTHLEMPVTSETVWRAIHGNPSTETN